MRLNYHPDTDSLYIDLSEQTSVESREISDSVVLDYDQSGKLVGIDIDHASARVELNRLVSRFPAHWQQLGRRDIDNWLNDTATALQVTAIALKWRIVQMKLFDRARLAEIADARLTSNGARGRAVLPRLLSSARNSRPAFNKASIQERCQCAVLLRSSALPSPNLPICSQRITCRFRSRRDARTCPSSSSIRTSSMMHGASRDEEHWRRVAS